MFQTILAILLLLIVIPFYALTKIFKGKQFYFLREDGDFSKKHSIAYKILHCMTGAIIGGILYSFIRNEEYFYENLIQPYPISIPILLVISFVFSVIIVTPLIHSFYLLGLKKKN